MILSFDVGLRFLSYCFMDCEEKSDLSSYKIHGWEVINTVDNNDYSCKMLKRDKVLCGKKSSMRFVRDGEEVYTCKVHFPKDIEKSKKNNFKMRNLKEYPLQKLCSLFLEKCEGIISENRELLDKTEKILIELQPSISPRNKLISHLLYGKLIENCKGNTVVKFVRASTKLKFMRKINGPIFECKLKGGYSRRKWQSVRQCEWIIENKFSEDEKRWLEVLKNGVCKSDDKSDCFLYCVNEIWGAGRPSLTSPITGGYPR